MNNLTEIKMRAKSVADTKQITGAMETISVAKMRKAMVRYENNLAFFTKIRETIGDIVLNTAYSGHKFISKRSGDKSAYIVIASDKGMAGGFNHNVLNFAYQCVKSHDNSIIHPVGLMASEFFEKKSYVVNDAFMGAGYEPNILDAIEIADKLVEEFNEGLIDEAYIVYTKLMSNSIMKPEIIKLLPLTKEDVIEGRSMTAEEEYRLSELVYDPDADAVLDKLIPQYLTGIVYGALIQSSASEHSARRAAMSNATKNANEILDDLHIEYNRARQEAVTNELTEIISGAAAVNAVNDEGSL